VATRLLELANTKLPEIFQQETATLLIYLLRCCATLGLHDVLNVLSQAEITDKIKKELNEALIEQGNDPS
jgi:DNA integrity scanning protein DisA with diadenylate cyclase activity